MNRGKSFLEREVLKAALEGDHPSVKRVEKLLDWMLDHGQEDRRVEVGCKTCNESSNPMASTARTAWLLFHRKHEVWIKNPFRKAKP
jgi:hypothetical protein